MKILLASRCMCGENFLTLGRISWQSVVSCPRYAKRIGIGLINCNGHLCLLTELRNVIFVVCTLGCVLFPRGGSRAHWAAKGGNLERVNLASQLGREREGGKQQRRCLRDRPRAHAGRRAVARQGRDVGLTDAKGNPMPPFGRVDAAGMLLAHEADVNALTPEEETPLDYAIDANAEVVELLRTNGGKTGAELSIHTAAGGEIFRRSSNIWMPEWMLISWTIPGHR